MNIKTINQRQKQLNDLQDKLASLKFLDPACGSGNFLTETYLSLRRLENKIIKARNEGQIILNAENPIKVSIKQFYGIEINDFAVSVAKAALWIAESQMLKETEDLINMNLDFFPLKSYPNIVEGNALRLDWESVVKKDELDYIMGNPPFVGASNMNKEQKKEVEEVFNSMKNWGNLDYVSAWFKKASVFTELSDIQCAFVSTNSIAQGEQVAILWKNLINNGININFAHKTFIWDSEASDKAHVHCVIIGFSYLDKRIKYIFDGERCKIVNKINSYLLEGENIFIESVSKPLSAKTKMIRGSSPVDNGNYSFTKEEKNNFVKNNPYLEKYIREYIGAKEFINNIPRYCIWLYGANPSDYRKSKDLMERVNNVVKFRLDSKKENTRELAETPLEWEANRHNDNDFILIPRVSSEKRKYIPIGFMDSKVIANDSVQLVPNATLYEFGILTSNVHNSWMRLIAGRLKSDYRYSNLVYNSFPWPEIDEKQKERIEKTAQDILDARALYPDASLADLYDELTMPPELRKAHQENDKAVMEAYGFNWRAMSESECVAELMKLYKKMIEKN